MQTFSVIQSEWSGGERSTKKSPENWTVDCWTPEYSNPGRLDDSLVIVVKTGGCDDNLPN